MKSNGLNLLLCALIVCSSSFSAEKGRADSNSFSLVPSRTAGWPQFRGPLRDGMSRETGLLKSWPEAGPPLVWQASDIGNGYSAPVISGGRIYITGDVEKTLYIYALDLNGKHLWKVKNGESWRGPYPGARASCTLDGDRFYHRNAHGRVACFDAKTGREIWAVDTLERFGGKNIRWGISECLVVWDGKVFVTMGGSKALMAALDKKTGDTVWVTDPGNTPPESASYASPILCRGNGRYVLFGATLRHHFGVDARTGKLLYTEPLPTKYSVVALMPVLCGNGIFITAPDTEAGGLFNFRWNGDALIHEKAWSAALDTCHGGAVFVNGFLHGSRYRNPRGWRCLDIRDGRICYETREITQGAVLYADKRLYCLSEKGKMALLEPTAEGYKFRGLFKLATAKRSDVWPHPVILDGRLYLRYHDQFFCYDIKAKKP